MHLQRQQRHVLGVLKVRLVLCREIANRGLADVGEQRIGLLEQRASQEDALAQARLGDFDSVETADRQHRLQGYRRRQDDVRTTGLDTRDRVALRRWQRSERRDQFAERITADQVALDADVDAADGTERSTWAAAARLRTAPPVPTSRPPCAVSHVASRSVRLT